MTSNSKKICLTCKGENHDLKACGQCFKAFYCSSECQKSDWKRHKRAECQTGKRFLKPVFPICSFCKHYSLQIKKCQQCQHAQYCSKECQKSHWKDHKDNCLARMTINEFIKSPGSFKNITQDVARHATRLEIEKRCTKLNEDPDSVDVNKEWKYIQKVGFRNSQAYLKSELRGGRPKEDVTCRVHDLDSAVQVAKEIYPNKNILTYLRHVPMELSADYEEHDIFVGLMVSWHPEIDQHGMYLVDACNMTSFVFVNEKVRNPRPHFYWSDLNPGNFVLIKRPLLRVFKNNYVGFLIEAAEEVNVIISQPCMINRLGKNIMTVGLHNGSQERRRLPTEMLYEISEKVDGLYSTLTEEIK